MNELANKPVWIKSVYLLDCYHWAFFTIWMPNVDPREKKQLNSEHNSDGMLTAKKSSAGVKLSISITVRTSQCVKEEIILKVLRKTCISRQPFIFPLKLVECWYSDVSLSVWHFTDLCLKNCSCAYSDISSYCGLYKMIIIKKNIAIGLLVFTS